MTQLRAGATTEPTIPEYFAFQRYVEDHVVRILALRLTLRPEDLPDRDLEIFADTVDLGTASLSLPGRSLLINAREVRSAGATLDVSGSAGQGFTRGDRAKRPGEDTEPIPGTDERGKEGADGKAGSDGAAGGKVLIVAERVVGPLKVRANGGPGGRGQDGGNGGPGGAGGAGRDGLAHGRQVVQEPTKGKQGRSGGAGGKGGESGYGGPAGEVRVVLVEEGASRDGVSMEASHGKKGDDGTHGSGGQGGPGGKGGVMYFDLGGGRPQPIPEHSKPDGPPGDPGSVGGGFYESMVKNLRPRSRADREKFWEANLNEVGRRDRSRAIRSLDWEEGNYHPAPEPPSVGHQGYEVLAKEYRPPLAQRELTFHQARLAFLARRYDAAGELLLWLTRVTPGDERRSGTHAPPESEWPEWRALHDRSIALLGFVHQGLDFFGNPPDFVPLVSIRAYRQALDPLLNLASIIENTHNDFVRSDRNRQQRQRDFERARQQVAGLLESLEARRRELGTSLERNHELLTQLDGARVAAHHTLEGADRDFQQAVLRQARQGCTFADVLRAANALIGLTAGAVELALSVRRGTAALRGLSQFQNKLENVGTVIRTVKSVRGGLSQVTESFRALRPELESDTPDVAKMIMAQEEFDELIEPFLHLPEAATYKQRMQDFVGIVQGRNRKLMESDTFRLKLSQTESEIAQLRSKVERLKTEWGTDAANDPTLPDYRSFMQGLYEDIKSNLLQLLYEEYRAFSYWSLSERVFSAADNTIAELAAEHGRLIDAMVRETNRLTSLPGVFQGTGVTLSKAERPEAFEAFRSSGELTFELPIGDPDSEFAGMANVRVTSWRAHLEGARTRDKLLKVDLHHSGKAAFTRADGGRIDFSHRRLFGRYGYHLETGEMTEQTDISRDESLIFLSPFTTWTLVLRKDLNRDLDLAEVTSIRLEFQGKQQPQARGRLARTAAGGEAPSLPVSGWCGFSTLD